MPQVSAIVIGPARPYARRSSTSPYWRDQGWTLEEGQMIGFYSAGARLFPGAIELRDSVVESALYYIYDPPRAILDGPHGPCFRYRNKVRGRQKYWIHFSEEPPNIDSGIIQIERDLASALKR
jgi:hypothetical protein